MIHASLPSRHICHLKVPQTEGHSTGINNAPPSYHSQPLSSQWKEILAVGEGVVWQGWALQEEKERLLHRRKGRRFQGQVQLIFTLILSFPTEAQTKNNEALS